jgi:ABC-type lipoprotein export system ATPase subunit
MIRIRSLQKFFNKGKQNEIHVIDNTTLDLPKQGMVALFGRSGCGKTTLLNVIGGLDGFESGELTVDGLDIRHKTDEIRNRYIGYIFQNYNLQTGQTCYENVASALLLCGVTDEAEISRRVTAALKNVGMEKYALRTPDTLSGGQQQRVAIARAIVKNPRVILADEPTGNLDEANTVMIMDLLRIFLIQLGINQGPKENRALRIKPKKLLMKAIAKKTILKKMKNLLILIV